MSRDSSAEDSAICEQNKLVIQYLKLVKGIVSQLIREKGLTTPREDLIQIGNLGLVKAARRFNPDNGAKFSGFAKPYIKGEILRYQRDKAGTIRIPRNEYKQGKAVKIVHLSERLAEVYLLDENKQEETDDTNVTCDLSWLSYKEKEVFDLFFDRDLSIRAIAIQLKRKNAKALKKLIRSSLSKVVILESCEPK